MARLRYNNQSGVLNAALTNVATTITFAVAPNFATIVSPDVIPLSLEPGTANFEVVYLTAYTAGALTGTITRAAEDATLHPAVAHLTAVPWVHGPTVVDFTSLALDAAVLHLAGVETVTGSKTVSGTGTVTLLADNTGGAQVLYGANRGTGYSAASGTQAIKIEAGDISYLNDVLHDWLAGINVQQWTADGAGITVGNNAAGDGIFIVTKDTAQAQSAPPNALNIFCGEASTQTTDTGTGGTVTYSATGLVDTSKAWSVNAWANRYVISGTIRGYVVSNTATALTLNGQGWTSTTAGPGVGQVTHAQPVNGATYTLPVPNGTGINIQRYGAGRALQIIGQSGSGTGTGAELIYLSQNVNRKILQVDDFGTSSDPTLAFTVTAKTTGQVWNIYHANSAMTGEAILLNMGNGTGTFTGAYIKGQLNSVTKFQVDGTGLGTFVGGLVITAGKSLDTVAAGTLNIGNSTATSVSVGKAGATLGFYGATAVARAAAIATPTSDTVGGKVAIDAIRNALKNVGITL